MSNREDRLWHVTTSPGSMRNWWTDNHGNAINAAGDIINRYCNCQGCLAETGEHRPKPQKEQKSE